MERMGNNMAEKGISQKSLKTLGSAAKKGIGQAKVNTCFILALDLQKSSKSVCLL